MTVSLPPSPRSIITQLTIRPNQMELCNRYSLSLQLSRWSRKSEARHINHMYNTSFFIKYRFKYYSQQKKKKNITSTYSRCINMAQWHQCVEKIREKMRNIFDKSFQSIHYWWIIKMNSSVFTIHTFDLEKIREKKEKQTEDIWLNYDKQIIYEVSVISR